MKSYLLFTSITCAKCPAFKEYVEKHVTFPGRTVNQNDSDFADLFTQYQVSSAPTLIILDEGEEVFRTSEEYELQQYLG